MCDLDRSLPLGKPITLHNDNNRGSSSDWFLIIWGQPAICYFEVSQSPSICWLSYPHSRSLSRPYNSFFRMQCSLRSASDFFSDHFSVVANLQIPSNHSRTIPQTIKYRKLQSINMEAFKADIQNSDLTRYPKTNATEPALQYGSVLHTLINLHAPLVSKKISLKPPNPWMTPAILTSKRHRRYLERVRCTNPTTLNRSKLTRQTHLCNRQMSKEKSAHYSKIIAEHSGDYGSLWKAFNKILHHCPKMHLPDHSSIVALANTFSLSFFNKISVIRSSFPSDSYSHVLNPPDTMKAL